MQSKPLEASPVVSNTTLAHDRLGGVVHTLAIEDCAEMRAVPINYYITTEDANQLVLAVRYLRNKVMHSDKKQEYEEGLSGVIINKLLDTYSHIK